MKEKQIKYDKLIEDRHVAEDGSMIDGHQLLTDTGSISKGFEIQNPTSSEKGYELRSGGQRKE